MAREAITEIGGLIRRSDKRIDSIDLSCAGHSEQIAELADQCARNSEALAELRDRVKALEDVAHTPSEKECATVPMDREALVEGGVLKI